MRLSLLALVLLVVPVRAEDDPPYLAAAKERQAKAKAFEVALSIRTEWKNVKAFGSDERKDYSGTGTARLAVDGEKFWCFTDMPVRTGLPGVLTHYRVEQTCDGKQVFTRNDGQLVKGERAGQFDTHFNVQVASPGVGWASWFAPLHWAYRATERGGLLADEESGSVPMTRTFQASGCEEVIGGTRCVEVVRTTTGPYKTTKASSWFDAGAGYVPKRIGDTVIDYVPHPVCGWRPSGWKTTYTHPTTQENTVTTVTVDAFDLPASNPNARFTIVFPAGARVTRVDGNRTETFLVAEDGSLVPVSADPPADPTPPQPEPPSVGRTLAVVGVTVALFAGFAVLLKRLARTRPDDAGTTGGAVP